MSPTEAVDRWLRLVVVAQNFCPFAGKPLAEGCVLIQEISGSNTEEVLLNCHSAVSAFRVDDKTETVLFVLPRGYDDFMDYLDLADAFELMLEEAFADELRLATFHPNYQFAEFAPADVVHHIHRAPYPILHVLRKKSIDAVSAGMEDTSEITLRNHQRAKELGMSFFEGFLKTD